MARLSLSVLFVLAITLTDAQKIEVFEKADKPEFLHWGKNTLLAQGYGFVILPQGDSLKGTLKVEKKNGEVSAYSIKTKNEKLSYLPAEVKSYGFYNYRIFTYEPKRLGNPKFYQGYVITRNGVKVKGRVAVMVVMGTEWKFFPKRIYFIPENGDMASSMAGGELLEVGQVTKDGWAYYDAFGDGYLQRLVSGVLRLSYNPNPGIITSPPTPESTSLDSTLIRDAQRKVDARLEEGGPLNEAVYGGKESNGLVMNIPIKTEIIEIEYFLKDTRSGQSFLLKESTFLDILRPLFSKCSSYSKLSSDALENIANYKKIEASVTWYNGNCK